MAGLVRHRQTQGSATDRLHLNHRATPRLHTNGFCGISTSPVTRLPGASLHNPSLKLQAPGDATDQRSSQIAETLLLWDVSGLVEQLQRELDLPRVVRSIARCANLA